MDKLKLTVTADNASDAKIAAAFLMVAFRKMGVTPTVTTKNMDQLLQLAADDMTIGMVFVSIAQQEGYVVTIDDGSVQAKPVLPETVRASMQAAAAYLRDVRTGSDADAEVEAWTLAAALDEQLK
jgi:hypothetical protein